MKKEVPDICLAEKVKQSKKNYADISNIDFNNVKASFGIALHMHQPTIPAGSDTLETASLVSNLQYMIEHQDTGDNHNAPVFLRCYSRISEFIRTLVASGHNPRSVQSQRWRQRLMHKFQYMFESDNVIGCVGCGRCSRSCSVNMNLKDHLINLERKL